jgi:hypothetical protein
LHFWINYAKHLPPVHKALVGRQDGGCFLVAPCDHSEEEAGILAPHGHVANFIQDQDFGLNQRREHFLEFVLFSGSFELGEHLIQCHEEHPMAGRDGFHSQGDAQVGLAHARWPKQDYVL